MTSVVIPGLDLVPSLPSRVVTVDLVDMTEGEQVAGAKIDFFLPADLHVPADDKILQAGRVTLTLNASGHGEIRLPAYTDAVRPVDWVIGVKKHWAPHPYFIRVPAGSTKISLADIDAVHKLPPDVLNWIITGVSLTMSEGAVMDGTAKISGGILDLDLTFPPGGIAWQRGVLTFDASALRLQEHEGMYRIISPASALEAGMPESMSGRLWVEWVRGINSATSIAHQEFVPENTTERVWRRRSSSSGWTPWERVDPEGLVGDRGLIGVRDLPEASDINAFKLREHRGPWRVTSSAVAGTISGLPSTPYGGTLWVDWIRGINPATSTALQEYLTEQGETFRRRSSSSSGWTPWEKIGTGGGDVIVLDQAVTKVDVIIAAGQSNMSGRGTPFGEEYGDTPDGRIWEYGANTAFLRPAQVPLDMHDINPNAGLSPATVFARHYARNAAPGTVVLIVPAAHGGTGFEPGATWNWADPSGQWSLREAMITQTQAAITAAESKWDEATVSVRAMLWHQGESTAGISDEADYITKLGAVIGDVRAVWPDTPVILGELSPDRSGGVSGTVTGQAHQIIPAEIERTALAHTPPNGSREGDLSHLGRYAVEKLGANMYMAKPAAIANQASILVMPPPRISSWVDGGQIRAEWEAPLCRATGYLVEHSTDGITWSATGVTTLGRRATLPQGAIYIRISTIGTTATSRPTQAHPIAGAL